MTPDPSRQESDQAPKNPEREALLVLMGWVERLEGGIAKDTGMRSAIAERLAVLRKQIESRDDA